MKPYVIAVDIGTTSTKAAVVDHSGNIKSVHAVEYPLHTPMPDRAEQDPYVILEAATTAVKHVVHKTSIKPGQVRCLSFSSAMHSLIALDRTGEPLTPCITWADNRSASYVRELYKQHDGYAIYRATGTPMHPMSPLLKLLWMRHKDAATFQLAHKFIGIKEFIMSRWCGVYIVDASIASATGLYSLNTRQWHLPSLAVAGIDAGRLSELVSTTHVHEGLQPSWAARLGLTTDIPVVAGASDGVLANVGIGAVKPDTYAVTIGTSGAVRAVVPQPTTDPLSRTFCYELTDHQWVVGGAINNGGVLFRWVRDELATLEASLARESGKDPYEQLASIAAEAPAGSGGLVVLPLFTGERAPYWNADARGVFFGLSLMHGKKHMIRAVLEGVGYAIRSVAEAVETATGTPGEIRASGGFARSSFWRQTLADILGVSLSVPSTIESSALGAAALGFYAMGDIERLDALVDGIPMDHRHEPNDSTRQTYDELFGIYQDLYSRLVEPFAQISKFQSDMHGTGEM
jgi:gluconokinase